MEKPVLLTAEGLEKLEKELEELRTVKRAEVAERIRYAKGFGDLSENAEYEDAKNEQGMIEGRILVLETMVRNAQLIEENHKGVVGVGSLVTISDEFGEETFTIVGPAEVDLLPLLHHFHHSGNHDPHHSTTLRHPHRHWRHENGRCPWWHGTLSCKERETSHTTGGSHSCTRPND